VHCWLAVDVHSPPEDHVVRCAKRIMVHGDHVAAPGLLNEMVITNKINKQIPWAGAILAELTRSPPDVCFSTASSA
jgi:hypothetical protein